MPRKPRILVVEDNPYVISETYKPYLAQVDGRIDYATSKLEALEKIRCTTYDFAYVDIMLREDTRDRGGVEVVKYLHDLKEGTAMAVVSATDDIKVAVTTYKTGIVDFISKEDIKSEQDLVAPLIKVLKDPKRKGIKYYGQFSTLEAYLASPEGVDYWVDSVFRTLRTGYQPMVDVLYRALDEFLPILRIKRSIKSFSTNSAHQSVSGRFWSKGMGFPVWFSMANAGGQLEEPPSEFKGDLVYNLDRGKIFASIWQLVNTRRNEFSDDLYEDFST